MFGGKDESSNVVLPSIECSHLPRAHGKPLRSNECQDSQYCDRNGGAGAASRVYCQRKCEKTCEYCKNKSLTRV